MFPYLKIKKVNPKRKGKKKKEVRIADKKNKKIYIFELH